MPLVNYNANNYQPGEAWAGGIRNMGAMLTQLPALRAMAAQRTATAAFQNAHANYETAATGKANAETDLTNEKTRGQKQVNDGSDQFKSGIGKWSANPSDPTALADILEGLGTGMRKDPDNTVKSIGQMMAMVMARNGTTNQSLLGDLQGGAATIYGDDQRAQRPVAVPAGGTLMSPAGQTLGTALAKTLPGAGGAAASSQIMNLPKQVIQDETDSGDVPLDHNGKPVKPVQMPVTIAQQLRATAAKLNNAGMSAPDAMATARSVVLGDSPTLTPNVTTNSPAKPAGIFSSAVPADVSTNSFSVTPDAGSTNQIMQALLAMNPRAAAALGANTNAPSVSPTNAISQAMAAPQPPQAPAAQAAPANPAPAAAPAPASGQKVLTPDIAAQYLQKFGNRADAENAALKDGFTW